MRVHCVIVRQCILTFLPSRQDIRFLNCKFPGDPHCLPVISTHFRQENKQWPIKSIKRLVIETTGVCVNNIARGVMTLCCDVMSCYITLRHYVFSNTHVHRSIFPKHSGRSHWCLYRHQSIPLRRKCFMKHHVAISDELNWGMKQWILLSRYLPQLINNSKFQFQILATIWNNKGRNKHYQNYQKTVEMKLPALCGVSNIFLL